MGTVIDALLRSDEPSVRWKIRAKVLDEDPRSPAMIRLADEIRRSPRVRALLAGVRGETYRKWFGRHWVLITLADIGYPPGDADLEPIAARTMQTWLAPPHYAEFATASPTEKGHGVPMMDGRYRRCASQQGGALLAAVTLGLAAESTAALVERLRHWQWPDGGWNCDRKLAAASSSVYETLLPMRGLAAYAAARSDPDARAACDRDVLAAAKGLMEAGRLADERCRDGLDRLERKELPGGGWAAEGRHYNAPGSSGQAEIVDWGGADPHRMNEWVTADALAVLHAAGRR